MRTPAAAFVPLRGRSVRNVSRTSPSSNARCTATSVSCGWPHSDSAKATSSSAAAPAAARSGAPKCSTSCSANRSTDGAAIGFARLHDLHQSRAAQRIARRGIRRGTPSAPCPQARRDRRSRIQTRRTPPIRPARPPSRTQTCRKDRAVWCATASRTRPAAFRIEPGGLGQPRQKLLPLDLGLAHAADQQIAVVVDIAAQALLRGSRFRYCAPPRRSRAPARRRSRP